MCELDFIKVGAFIGFSVSLIVLCYVMYRSVKGEFKSKNTPKQPEEYNEHNLPKGCELIQVGDKYMFKIKSKFVDMGNSGYFLWSIQEHIAVFAVTKDKQYAIKQGLETFEFFKALGKI